MSEFLRASTPICLIVAGTVLGAVAIASPSLSDSARSAGLGLAASAITGAAGLAQTSSASTVVKKDDKS